MDSDDSGQNDLAEHEGNYDKDIRTKLIHANTVSESGKRKPVLEI